MSAAKPAERMIAPLCGIGSSDAAAPPATSAIGQTGDAALFRSMMACSAPFRIEGENRFVTDVEIFWHPGWVGADQARTFSIEDDIPSVTTGETLHPMFPGRNGAGVLKWRRTSAF